jgi:CRP-like cAMP-binding protein
LRKNQRNLFLDSLSSESRTLLMSLSAKVRLPSGAVLYRAREIPAYAYFLTSGVASTITRTINGDSAEVGLLGNEAVVGSLQLLGPARVPAESMVQIEATALRIPLPTFRNLFRSSEEIRNRVLEFVQNESLTILQIAGCHRLHGTEERMARWLLMVEERIQSDKLELTQSFLALMLGIRRPTVTLVARGLQKRGLLELGRGYLRILSRPLLEAASCECYLTVRELYMHLYRAYGSSESNPSETAGSGNRARM